MCPLQEVSLYGVLLSEVVVGCIQGVHFKKLHTPMQEFCPLYQHSVIFKTWRTHPQGPAHPKQKPVLTT